MNRITQDNYDFINQARDDVPTSTHTSFVFPPITTTWESPHKWASNLGKKANASRNKGRNEWYEKQASEAEKRWREGDTTDHYEMAKKLFEESAIKGVSLNSLKKKLNQLARAIGRTDLIKGFNHQPPIPK